MARAGPVTGGYVEKAWGGNQLRGRKTGNERSLTKTWGGMARILMEGNGAFLWVRNARRSVRGGSCRWGFCWLNGLRVGAWGGTGVQKVSYSYREHRRKVFLLVFLRK